MNDNQTATAIVLALKKFENDELAATNNCLQWLDKMQPQNIAYQKALETQLIRESGYPTFDLEPMRTALAYEVNRRVAAGEWTGSNDRKGEMMDKCNHFSGVHAGDLISTVRFYDPETDTAQEVETQDDTAVCPFCGHENTGVTPLGD